MGLETHDTVHHMGAGFLEPVGELDVGLLIKAGAQLDDDGHILAGLRRSHQGIHDRGIMPGAIQGLFDGAAPGGPVRPDERSP